MNSNKVGLKVYNLKTSIHFNLFWYLKGYEFCNSGTGLNHQGNPKSQYILLKLGGTFKMLDMIRYGLTSPAPRNKNLWSAKDPPTNFKAATSPARTTDAVPWDSTMAIISETIETNQRVKSKVQGQPECHH